MLDAISAFTSSIGDLARATGDFFSAIHDKETWIRVASVLFGILLIATALWPRR